MMQLPLKTRTGTILKRYKRFLADITLDSGETVVVHVPNTGSMKTCWEPGWKVIVSESDNPLRKLKYTLEMLHNGSTWIGVNTSNPMKIVIEALKNKIITELAEYDDIKPEVKIGDSRIDLLLKNKKAEECYVEIKNVTLLGDNNVALFPDGVSDRGSKHLHELIKIKKNGRRACMLFVIQREDVNHFSPAHLIDPTYAKNLTEAYQNGVEILCYQCELSPQSIELKRRLDFSLLS